MRFHLPLLLLCGALSACNPTYNWRDYASPDAPYRVMFPDKPAKHTRMVDLDGTAVSMTMTAAEVEGTMFAVGSADTADAAHAQAAVAAMKTAMLRNIDARVTHEQTLPGPALEVVADGGRGARPLHMVARFQARGKRIYQVVAIGPADHMVPEQVDQFMSSFALQ
jgi:hypothetical protein